jgi:predicted RNA-binding Zn ribbon-like protein
MATTDLAKIMQDFALRLRLPFRPLPYQLRHTGASTDMAEKARSLQDIKRRGRWQADSSVKRYEKAAVLTKVFNSLSIAAQNFCLHSARELPEVIYGRRVIRSLG